MKRRAGSARVARSHKVDAYAFASRGWMACVLYIRDTVLANGQVMVHRNIQNYRGSRVFLWLFMNRTPYVREPYRFTYTQGRASDEPLLVREFTTMINRWEPVCAHIGGRRRAPPPWKRYAGVALLCRTSYTRAVDKPVCEQKTASFDFGIGLIFFYALAK